MEPAEWLAVFVFVVVVAIVAGAVAYVKNSQNPTPPPAPTTPSPPATPTPPTPPPPPTPPTVSFLSPPDQVIVAQRTVFTYYADLVGFPLVGSDTSFVIAVPNQNGVLTALIGEGAAKRWDPSEGTLQSTQITARSNFANVQRGQVTVEIYIDHETPDGDPPDCTLTATDISSGASVTHRFRGVAPP